MKRKFSDKGNLGKRASSKITWNDQRHLPKQKIVMERKMGSHKEEKKHSDKMYE